MEAVANRVMIGWRRVLSWFKDDVFRRLFLNAGKLLSAHVVASILQIVAAVLAARALGPAGYGILALILAYEVTVGKLVTFNAWQIVIKFGSEALEKNDPSALRQLIKFGFGLDIGSAIVGTVLAMSLAGPVVGLLGWDQSVRPLLVLYSVLILFSFSGTPIGILRLFNRFDLLSYAAVLHAVIRLAGVLWCFVTGQDLLGFILAYLLAGSIGQLYQVTASLRVLRKERIRGIWGQSLRGIIRRFPSLWEYVWTGHVDSTVRTCSREVDELVVAGFTTPVALGVFKIAKQFARVLPMLSDPLYHSIYPELSRLWTKGDRRGLIALVRRSTSLVGILAMGIWIFFICCGRSLIALTVGPEYMSAYPVAIVYILALVIALVSFSFTPLALAVGKPKTPLKSDVVATILYLIAVVLLLVFSGITGAAIAYVFYYLTWSTMMLCSLRFVFRDK